MYIVFQASLAGFKHIGGMDSDTIKGAVQNISKVSQNYVYHIYQSHNMRLPLLGTYFDTYKHCKSVAGDQVKNPKMDCHEYALTNQWSMAWFFTDNMFEGVTDESDEIESEEDQ
jgi:hypothetical protein